MANNVTPGMITFLQQRNSATKLTEPGPDSAELADILQAALRAPDHARLLPSRFLSIRGEGRKALGALFVQACEAGASSSLSEEKRQSVAGKAMRAPLIIVAVAATQEHPKVPEIEQILTVGCAVQNMLLAVEALGYRAIWRTGDMAYNPLVHEGLGLQSHEKIVGFVYIGTPLGKQKSINMPDPKDYLQTWPPRFES